MTKTGNGSRRTLHRHFTEGMKAFDAWLSFRQLVNGGLGPATVEKYRGIWKRWLTWLAEEEHRPVWKDADPRHVDEFLNSLASVSVRRTEERATPNSRKKYFRILREVYAHALEVGLVDVTPSVRHEAALVRTDVPPPAMDGFTLRTLQQSLPPAGDTWQSIRDRAILAALAFLGLTVSELQSLQLADLAPAQDGEDPPLQLTIIGTRSQQPRTLDLDPECALAIQQWLVARRGLIASGGSLFIQRKGLKEVSAKTLYLLAKTWLSSFSPQHVVPGKHLGPGVIRTAVIADWIAQRLPEAEVLRRSGFTEPASLKRFPKPPESAEPPG